ncbi:Lrp/AsnC family transcriptional regulator [Sphingobium sp. LMC3-1-1.1]|uniref:Lrp/AsnC family transcriptional regulator n=2 Tax=Sphingobium TaxID=165695 RepID=UPI00341E1E1F
MAKEAPQVTDRRDRESAPSATGSTRAVVGRGAATQDMQHSKFVDDCQPASARGRISAFFFVPFSIKFIAYPARAMKNDPLDSFDRKLIELLQADAQRPVSALAESVGLSPPACYRRIRRLRAIGIIEREVAIVRPRNLGWPLSMIVLVSLERESARTMNEMMEIFRNEPEILEAWNVTGDHDFALRIVARDMEGYDNLAQRLFAANDGIRTFKTLVIIREVKPLSPVPVKGPS